MQLRALGGSISAIERDPIKTVNDVLHPSVSDPSDAPPAQQRLAALLPMLQRIQGDLTPEGDRTAFAALAELTSFGDACPELVACLLAIATRCYYANDLGTGLRVTSLAVRHAKRLPDQSLRCKALMTHGLQYRQVGDAAAAIETYLEALDAARSANDPVLEARVWNNVGNLLKDSAQFHDALQCYARVVELAAKSDAVVRLACGNAALSHLELNDLTSGIKSARRSIALNEAPRDAQALVVRISAESALSEMLWKAGDLAGADRHAAAAEEFHERLPRPVAGIHLEILRAQIAIARGDIAEGTACLTAALERGRREFPHEITQVLLDCADGFESAGQSDVALVYVQELLSLRRESLAQQLLEKLQCVMTVSAPAQPDQVVIAKAVALEAAVNNAIGDLVNAAVTASEQAGHDRARIFRVSRLAELFAGHVGWAEQLPHLPLAARLADIGMLVVPNALLRKPRSLSVGEKRIVYEHTQFGAELLSRARLAMLQPCVLVARYHHERWDGSGPWALTGEAIPAEARIVALCDVFDALTHDRPWRQAYTTHAALLEIEAGTGSQFDPVLARRFVQYVRAESCKHLDFEAFLSEDARDNGYVRTRDTIAAMLAEPASCS